MSWKPTLGDLFRVPATDTLLPPPFASDPGSAADPAERSTEEPMRSEGAGEHYEVTPAEAPESHDESTSAEAPESYDEPTSAEATESYDESTPAEATESYDEPTSAEATESYDESIPAEAAESCDEPVCAEDAEASDESIPAEEAESYDEPVCAEDAEASDESIPAEEAESYDEPISVEASESCDESTSGEATQSEAAHIGYDITSAGSLAIDAAWGASALDQDPASGTESLDQVRDLLFGDQRSRIDHVEAAQREAAELIARIRESAEELRMAVDGLTARFDEQAGLISGAESRIDQISGAIGSRVDSIDERLALSQRDIREEFSGHRAALVGLVNERTEELIQLLHEELKPIKGEQHSERMAIAAMLRDVASHFEISDG